MRIEKKRGSGQVNGNGTFLARHQGRVFFALGGVIILLTLALAALGYFLFQLKNNESVNPISEFLSPMRAVVDDEDVIVNFTPLRNYLNDKYETDPGVSIYFEFLNTGSNISISKDAEFFPASLLKVPVAMSAVKKIENKTWKWANELVILAGDKDEHFGDLYKEPTGSRHTIESLVKKSLVDSDNTAYSIILRNLEQEEVEAVYKHLGLDDFFAKGGKISAKRYAVVLRSLYHAAFLTKDASEKVITWLTETPFTEYLEQGLPKGVRFAHKIGVSDAEDVFMDAGIVYAPDRPYILIVMTHNKDEKTAKSIMKDISGKTYNYVVNYNGGDENIEIQ